MMILVNVSSGGMPWPTPLAVVANPGVLRFPSKGAVA